MSRAVLPTLAAAGYFAPWLTTAPKGSEIFLVSFDSSTPLASA
jgi:hypothetical protein